MSFRMLLRAYSRKKNHVRIYRLPRELNKFKQEDKSQGDYYAIVRGLWYELRLYQAHNPWCEKKQEKHLKVQRLNPDYETVRAHILSQDPMVL